MATTARSALLVACAVLLVAGVVGWQVYQQARADAERIRVLAGQLTARESDLEAAHAELATARARPVTQAAATEQLRDLAKSGQLPAGLPAFARSHDARVSEVTTARLEMVEQLHGAGSSPHSPIPQAARAVPEGAGSSLPISLDWRSSDGAFHFLAPDVAHPETATLETDEQFRLAAVVLASGQLRQESLQLQRVVPDGAGWRPVGTARLVAPELSYVPPPAPARPWFDPAVIVDVGASLGGRLPLQPAFRLGLGLMLLRWRDFGLQVDAFTDLRSLAGSGGALGVFWRPTIADRGNFALSAGCGAGLDGGARPFVAVDFVAW